MLVDKTNQWALSVVLAHPQPPTRTARKWFRVNQVIENNFIAIQISSRKTTCNQCQDEWCPSSHFPDGQRQWNPFLWYEGLPFQSRHSSAASHDRQVFFDQCSNDSGSMNGISFENPARRLKWFSSHTKSSKIEGRRRESERDLFFKFQFADLNLAVDLLVFILGLKVHKWHQHHPLCPLSNKYSLNVERLPLIGRINSLSDKID